MKVLTRKVYYCEHCNRHRLTARAIETHEPRCIRNPARSYCGWHGRVEHDWPALAARFRDDPDEEKLRDELDGCPACMLTVVVQADLSFAQKAELMFSYDKAVADYRDRERSPLDW